MDFFLFFLFLKRTRKTSVYVEMLTTLQKLGAKAELQDYIPILIILLLFLFLNYILVSSF